MFMSCQHWIHIMEKWNSFFRWDSIEFQQSSNILENEKWKYCKPPQAIKLTILITINKCIETKLQNFSLFQVCFHRMQCAILNFRTAVDLSEIGWFLFFASIRFVLLRCGGFQKKYFYFFGYSQKNYFLARRMYSLNREKKAIIVTYICNKITWFIEYWRARRVAQTVIQWSAASCSFSSFFLHLLFFVVRKVRAKILEKNINYEPWKSVIENRSIDLLSSHFSIWGIKPGMKMSIETNRYDSCQNHIIG